MGCLFRLILYIVFLALSWAFIIGLSAVVCVCFGLAWSLSVATGTWLVLVVLFLLFGSSKK